MIIRTVMIRSTILPINLGWDQGKCGADLHGVTNVPAALKHGGCHLGDMPCPVG